MPLRDIPEPFLTAELENFAEDGTLASHEWCAQALEELARQLGIANDYYFPLIGSAQKLRDHR